MHQGRFCSHYVVVMKMSVEQIAHGFVSPLANLCNVLARHGGQETGVNDENLPVANNHRGISTGVAVIQIVVLDAVNALRQLGYLTPVGICGFAECWTNSDQ